MIPVCLRGARRGRVASDSLPVCLRVRTQPWPQGFWLLRRIGGSRRLGSGHYRRLKPRRTATAIAPVGVGPRIPPKACDSLRLWSPATPGVCGTGNNKLIKRKICSWDFPGACDPPTPPFPALKVAARPPGWGADRYDSGGTQPFLPAWRKTLQTGTLCPFHASTV